VSQTNLKSVYLKYGDILRSERPVSERHPHMSNYDRAAQFSPFAALTGYEDEIDETARYTDMDIFLDESRTSVLDAKLQKIRERISEGVSARITYFVPDEKKSGGHFSTTGGRIRKVDEYERIVQFSDGTRVEIERIKNIEIEE